MKWMPKLKSLANKKYWKHAAIGVLSIILLFVALVNLGMAGLVIWLRGEAGQNFVQTQVAAATAQSGYEIDFSHFSYSFPQGLSVRDLKVADEDGLILEADYITLRPRILPLAARQASLSLDAGTLVLHRLPEAQEEEIEEEEKKPFALTPFAVPDIYFTQIALNNLDIDRLDIREPVMGQNLILSPRFYTRLRLQEDMSVTLDWALEAEESDIPLPRRLKLQANLNPQSLKGALEDLNVNGDAYEITGEGAFDLSESGAIDVVLEAASDELSSLGAPEGSFEMEGHIGGTLHQPAINAKGTLVLEEAKSKGLDDIDFALRMEDPANVQSGRFMLSSAYNDLPIELSTEILREDNIIRFDTIKGSAPAIDLNGQITLDLDTTLADGKINLQVTDLNRYSQIAGFNIGGNGSLHLTLAPQNNAQSASIELAMNNLRYQDIRLEKITASTRFPDVSAGLPDALDISASGLVAAPDIRLRELNAKLSNRGQDAYTLTLDGRGFVKKPIRLNGLVNLAGLQAQNPKASSIDLDIRYARSQINIGGSASMTALDITTVLDDFKLSSLPAELPVQLQDMTINGDIKLSGTPAAPLFNADLQTSSFVPVEGESVVISANAEYAANRAQASFEVAGDRIQRMEGRASVDMRFTLSPFVFEWINGGTLSGLVEMDAQASQLATLFLPPGHEATGEINAQIDIGGNISAPDIDGFLNMRGGSYLYEEYGAQLHDLNLTSRFTTDRLLIEEITATDREAGTLNGSGSVFFKDMAQTEINLAMNNFHIVDSQRANGYISSNLALQGQENGFLLSGDINLGQFDISIPERFQTSIPTLNIVEKETQGSEQLKVFALDIDVNADDRIFVRGWGLDAEFGGNLEIRGDLGEPLVYGNMASRRGRYEEFGRRFTLEQAELRFQGAMPPSPYLNIRATHPVDDLITQISLSGSVQTPKITLSSVPSLPQDEVMSHILFGRDMSRITPFQAIQLKNTLDRFSGRGGNGFDPLGTLRGITGVDDIRVDEDAEGNASVGVGKYLTDKVYLELEQGAGEASGAATLQIEVTPNIDVETEIGQDAQAGAGVLWRWDY